MNQKYQATLDRVLKDIDPIISKANLDPLVNLPAGNVNLGSSIGFSLSMLWRLIDATGLSSLFIKSLTSQNIQVDQTDQKFTATVVMQGQFKSPIEVVIGGELHYMLFIAPLAEPLSGKASIFQPGFSATGACAGSINSNGLCIETMTFPDVQFHESSVNVFLNMAGPSEIQAARGRAEQIIENEIRTRGVNNINVHVTMAINEGLKKIMPKCS